MSNNGYNVLYPTYNYTYICKIKVRYFIYFYKINYRSSKYSIY